MKKGIFSGTLFLVSSFAVGAEVDEAHFWRIQDAGRYADQQKAQQLLDEGMDINARGALGYSMLTHATTYLYEHDADAVSDEKRLAFIEFLLQKGAAVNHNVKSWDEVPILNAASSQIALKIIPLLRKYGADINATHSNKMTPLHLAAWQGRKDLVEYLLDENAMVDLPDNDGMTPLIRAAFWDYDEIVQLLLDHGASDDREDNSGRIALNYASRYDQGSQARQILSEKRAIDLQTFNQWARSLVGKPIDDKRLRKLFKAWKKTAE